MPRTIVFEGRQITVPDDATDAEIGNLIGGDAQSNVSTRQDSIARGLPPLMVRQRGPFGMQEVPAERSTVAHQGSLSEGLQTVGDAGGAMLTGVAGSLPGIPGNIEALGRFALSPLGVSRETALPTSADVQDAIAGPAPNELVAGWRQVGDIFGPGIWTALLKGAANVPSAIGKSASGTPDPNVAALAQRAQALGVPVRPGQAASSKVVKVVDDQLAALPPSLTGNSASNPTRITPDAQFEAFTRAVSKTVGEDEPALTTTVMAKVAKKISDVYKAVLPRNQVAPSPDLQTALDDIRLNAKDALDDDSVKPVLNALDKIEGKLKVGPLSGRQYQTMRARGGMISAVSESQNTTVAHYGNKIRDALDDAFEAQAQGNDAAEMKQAREWLRNYKILEPLAEKAPTGKISPALLLGQVAKSYPDFATGGGGDIGDLARIGQQFLKSPPNSETATRSWVMRTLENPGAALAKTAAAPVIATVGRAMNAGINSPASASRLFGNPAQNSVLPGGGANIPALDPRLLAMMSPAMLAALLAPSTNAGP